MTHEEERIRTIAGYLLKNNARLILSASPDVSEFVKTAVLSAFNDNAAMIRSAASQDIVAFLGVLEPRNWPECLHHLFMALDSEDPERQEVSFFFYFSPPNQEPLTSYHTAHLVCGVMMIALITFFVLKLPL